MADQYLYKYISQLSIPFNAVTSGYFRRYFNLLNGSAGEMLVNHISTDGSPLLPISSSTFGPSASRIAFLSDLNLIGSYPQYCKKLALSNGSIEGYNQIRYWDNTDRVPNDKIIDLNAEIYLRVLGIRILGSAHTLTMNTAPLGNGHLFRATAGISHWKIKLKWFGVKLVWGTTYYINIDKSGINMQPIDVTAGSNMINGLPFGSGTGFNFLDVIGFNSSASGGGLVATGTLGIPWFGNANLNFSAYSDGIGFNFIPTQSSADFSSHPLNYNFLNDPVATNMANTPFDVIYPHVVSFYPPFDKNGSHLDVLNKELQTCATCLSGNPNFYPVNSYLLNREIGDDTLWLENTTAGIGFRNIEAEQVLYANLPNIYYNYPTANSTLPGYDLSVSSDLVKILSKDNPYTITTSNANSFRSNSSFIVNPSVPITGPYSYSTGAMTICCLNYASAKMIPQQKKQNLQLHGSTLRVYPNPQSANNFITINYSFKVNRPVVLQLFDITGRLLKEWKPLFDDNTAQCYYPIKLHSHPGSMS